MNRNYTFRSIDDALPELSRQVLTEGDVLNSRNGRVRELDNVGITLLEPWHRVITTSNRRASIAAQIAETVWVLSGRNDIQWLSRYLPRAVDFSDDGVTWRGAYGKRIRSWPRRDGSTSVVDQLAFVTRLLRDYPKTRRAVITLYDPVVDSRGGKDIPCNNWMSFSIRDRLLDLHVAVRSNDLIWGWSGINAFEWSALQEIVAGMLGPDVGVGRLHFSISSLHLYQKHWERAHRIADGGVPALAAGDPRFWLPNIQHNPIDSLDILLAQWFEVEGRIHAMKGALDQETVRQAINQFNEPMLKSWLQVIAHHWTGDESWLEGLEETALRYAALHDPTRTRQAEPEPEPEPEIVSDDKETRFTNYVANLHMDKHRAYGDSWKRRGEMLGIMANIARKVDRLGVSGAGDTAADTAVDLLVYLIKYRLWLTDYADAPYPMDFQGALVRGVPAENVSNLSDFAIPVTVMLERERDREVRCSLTIGDAESTLTDRFDRLERLVTADDANRYRLVDQMIGTAWCLALQLWIKEDAK